MRVCLANQPDAANKGTRLGFTASQVHRHYSLKLVMQSLCNKASKGRNAAIPC